MYLCVIYFALSEPHRRRISLVLVDFQTNNLPYSRTITSLTQGVRVNNSYSKKSDNKYGVQQSSVLGPQLFNIHLIDLHLECEDDNISSYADGTTPYSVYKIYHL